MRRTALWILAIAGGLVALVVIAVAIAIYAVDVNRFVAPVQARVKAATGRDLEIKGGVRIAPSLSPEIVVSDVRLANAPWGQAPALASAKRLDAQIALVPLLSGRVEVLRIELHEPVIALETDAKGQGNWALGGPAAAAPAPPGAAPSVPIPFGLGNLLVRNGRLSYRDGKSGQTTVVAIETLSLRSRGPDAPVQAEFRGRVDDVPVTLAGQLGPSGALLARRWPYPIDLAGEVGGQKSALGTKLAMEGATLSLADTSLAYGKHSFEGRVAIDSGGARPKYVVDATLPVLDVPALTQRPGPERPAPAATPSSRVFPDTPVPLAGLAAVDADVHLAIGTLTLREGLVLQQTDLRFTLAGGKLDAPALKTQLFGGNVTARLAVDATRPEPALQLRAEASGVALGPLLAVAGVKRDVKDARLALRAEIATRGVSPHAWASGADGHVLASVGRGTLAAAQADPSAPTTALFDAINPFRRADPSTELVCAVVRLPLAGGVARIDRSIAAETSKLAVSASGTLDFRSETLDLAFNPRLRQGIQLDVAQVAELVRLKGTFAEPRVSVDAMASVATVARIGAAVGTGGLSVLGESLLKQGAQGSGAGASACEVALHGGPATREERAPASPAPQGKSPDALGKSLQQLFRR